MNAVSRCWRSAAFAECSKRMGRMIAFSAMEIDARSVRAGEDLDWPRLVAWLRERLPACGIAGLDVAAEPTVAQFPGGHSNLTYLVRFGDVDVVVRRQSLGPVSPD